MPLDPPARGENSRDFAREEPLHLTEKQALQESPLTALQSHACLTKGVRTSFQLVRNSVLYMAQTMNGDHAGAIESFWRSLDVKLRYPGLCRLNAW